MRWSGLTPLATAALVGLLHACFSGPSADLILRGGRIYTVDREQPWAEAVAIRGDKFIAVGPNQDIPGGYFQRALETDLLSRNAADKQSLRALRYYPGWAPAWD